MVSVNVFPCAVFRQSDYSGEDRSGIDLQNRTGFPVTRLIKNKPNEHQLLIVGILADCDDLSTRIKNKRSSCVTFILSYSMTGCTRTSAILQGSCLSVLHCGICVVGMLQWFLFKYKTILLPTDTRF